MQFGHHEPATTVDEPTTALIRCGLGSTNVRMRIPILLLLIAGACAPAALPGPARLAAPPAAPATVVPVGLTRVLGRPAADVVALIGSPTLDRTEGKGHQLQFARGPCVLDLFLYAPATGAEPRVKYAFARRKDGRPLDPASCLQSQIIAAH